MKMYKYIITWVISTIVMTACPRQDRIDEFGIKSNENIDCLVYHHKIVKESKTKEFLNRKEAYAFYNRGKQQSKYNSRDIFYNSNSSITEIKIDSVLIDPTKPQQNEK